MRGMTREAWARVFKTEWDRSPVMRAKFPDFQEYSSARSESIPQNWGSASAAVAVCSAQVVPDRASETEELTAAQWMASNLK